MSYQSPSRSCVGVVSNAGRVLGSVQPETMGFSVWKSSSLEISLEVGAAAETFLVGEPGK